MHHEIIHTKGTAFASEILTIIDAVKSFASLSSNGLTQNTTLQSVKKLYLQHFVVYRVSHRNNKFS